MKIQDKIIRKIVKLRSKLYNDLSPEFLMEIETEEDARMFRLEIGLTINNLIKEIQESK